LGAEECFFHRIYLYKDQRHPFQLTLDMELEPIGSGSMANSAFTMTAINRNNLPGRDLIMG